MCTCNSEWLLSHLVIGGLLQLDGAPVYMNLSTLHMGLYGVCSSHTGGGGTHEHIQITCVKHQLCSFWLTDHLPLIVDHHSQVLEDLVHVLDVGLRRRQGEGVLAGGESYRVPASEGWGGCTVPPAVWCWSLSPWWSPGSPQWPGAPRSESGSHPTHPHCNNTHFISQRYGPLWHSVMLCQTVQTFP